MIHGMRIEGLNALNIGPDWRSTLVFHQKHPHHAESAVLSFTDPMGSACSALSCFVQP